MELLIENRCLAGVLPIGSTYSYDSINNTGRAVYVKLDDGVNGASWFFCKAKEDIKELPMKFTTGKEDPVYLVSLPEHKPEPDTIEPKKRWAYL